MQIMKIMQIYLLPDSRPDLCFVNKNYFAFYRHHFLIFLIEYERAYASTITTQPKCPSALSKCTKHKNRIRKLKFNYERMHERKKAQKMFATEKTKTKT